MAIYNALNNVVSVPVFDEKTSVSSTATLYVLLSTQQEVAEDTDDAFMTKSFIDIEVCHKTGSEVSKDTMDDISNEVLQILFPTAWAVGISEPSGFQIQNMKRESTLTRVLEISPTESILRKIIKISAIIIQQF